MAAAADDDDNSVDVSPQIKNLRIAIRGIKSTEKENKTLRGNERPARGVDQKHKSELSRQYRQ